MYLGKLVVITGSENACLSYSTITSKLIISSPTESANTCKFIGCPTLYLLKSSFDFIEIDPLLFRLNPEFRIPYWF